MALVNKTFSDIITFTRASTATFFNSAGVLTSAATNAPRFDYNPSTLAAQGLLIEESRANVCLDSADLAAGDRGGLTGWYAITRASIVSNAIIAPDGTTTADKIVADSTNNTHFAANRTTAGSTTNTNPITVSGFFKAAELSFSSILITEGATYARNSIVFFDLSAGTATVPSVSGGAASASATITPVGNGWYRCTLTVTLGGTDTRVEIRAYPTNSTSTATFTGNSVNGVYAWGFQIEAGAFPTSYIPTTTTALTRAADVASVNTLSPWFNATESTLYLEAVPVGVRSVASPIVTIDDGTTSNRIAMTATAANAMQNSTVVSGALSGNTTTPATTYAAGSTYKIAFAVQLDNVQSASGGASGIVDTTALIPSGLTALKFTAQGASSGLNNFWFRRFTYYPRRLSAAELAAITA